MVIEALKAGKHVFVEKPLCVNEEELNQITDVRYQMPDKLLMVGYNRRFSSHSQKTLEAIKDRSDPLLINYRINAGFVPSDHWVHSEEEGGSRIVGEVCHFVDLLQFLINSEPVKIYAERVSGNNKSIINSDNVIIVIKFKDGSVGNIFYTASGDKAFSREQIEIFSEGKTIVIKDYKQTKIYFNGKKCSFKTINQDMGYKNELKHFINCIRGAEKPKLVYQEIYLSTLSILKINESLGKGLPANINYG